MKTSTPCRLSQYVSHFITRSDNYTNQEMRLLGETDRIDGMTIILTFSFKACEYLSQIPCGGVCRRKFSHVMVADALHPLRNHHIYPTGILSQLLNNMNKDTTFVNVSETEGYIHITLKDCLFCVGLKQFDLAGKSNCVVSLGSPMLQRNAESGAEKLCVIVTLHIYMMSIHKLGMLCYLLKKILEKIGVPGICRIIFLAPTHNTIDRSDGALTCDNQKDKTILKYCVNSNTVPLLWSDTPIVFRWMVNVDWISIERPVFRTWNLRKLILEPSDTVNLGEGRNVTSDLKRILDYTQNTHTLAKHDLKIHVFGISNDAENQQLEVWHQLVQILLLLVALSCMATYRVDNVLQKMITPEIIASSDDKCNNEGEIVQHDHLSTADVSEQKSVVHTVDQLYGLNIYNDSRQYLSETYEADTSSMFDKREAYNLFQNVNDKSLANAFRSFKREVDEQLKFDKGSLYGDEFTRHVNTWQEVRVAPFYSLRPYFRKLETGENDEKMVYEALRLGSFCGININAFCIRLAEAGFYATGDGDETRCFSCGVRHRGWQRKDNPFLIHRQIAPLCPHISGDERRNVPINSNAEPYSVPSAEDNPVAGGDAGFGFGANTNEVLTNQSQITETYPTISTNSYVSCDGGDKAASASRELLDRSDRADADAGQDHTTYILRFEDAVHPTYSDNMVRMASFLMWPQHHCKRPEELVPVGFFYAGYSDCVRCFVCGVGLKTWEEGDDPWVEHVRWRSSCNYVKAIKGDVFITQTLAALGQKLRSEQTSTNTCRHAEIVSARNDSDDILQREACQRALEMGYSRDCVRKHALYILRNQGIDSLQLPLLVERILQEDVTEIPEPAAATTQALAATKTHVLPAPVGETDKPTSPPPQGDTLSEGETDRPTSLPPLGDTLSGGETDRATSLIPQGDTLSGGETDRATSLIPQGDTLSGGETDRAKSLIPQGDTFSGGETDRATSLPPQGDTLSGGETDRASSLPPQGDTLSGQQQGQVESDGEHDGYWDTDKPRTSSGNKYQSMPTLSSDRSRILNAKVKAQNKTTEDLEATEEETQQLRESGACKICLEDPANIVFLPCGHLVACAMCSPALERCPICRRHILGSVRVHLADMASVTSS